MLKKSLILCGVLVALVNCSSDNDKKTVQTLPSDTSTEIINSKGEVIEVIEPAGEKPAVDVPSADALIKQTWQDIGFTKEYLMSELMGGDVCALGEKQYVGCFFAANALIPTLYGNGAILIVQGQVNSEFIGEKIKDLGPFAVHKKKEVSIDVKDPAAVSAYSKKDNDFFKETVAAAVSLYRSKIATSPLTQNVIKNYLTVFPEVLKKLETAKKEKDSVKFDAAAKELKVLGVEIADTKKKIEETLFKDYVAIIDDAFEKFPAADRAMQASEVYGEYLRNSADGHARITLHDALLKEVAKKAPTEQQAGIGIEIISAQDGIFMKPIPGSQAGLAGVQENDRLINVDGMVPKDLNEAATNIRGPRHTDEKPSTVTITIERWATKKQETFTIKRMPIAVPSYSFSQKTVNSKNYGVIRIASFMDGEMADAVRQYVTENDKSVDGWIMDLRGNPGGLLDQANELLSVFLPEKSATVAQSSETNPDEIDMSSMEFTSKPQATTKNLVVLVNGGSASASEIVAGVLQEYKRALIAGETSFGKGTVQRSGHKYHPDIPAYNVWDDFNNQVMGPMGPQEMSMIVFWKTIGRYFYPSGRTPEWVGVTPDIKVLPNPETIEGFAAREQDLIPFSFGNLGAPWEQTRVDLVSKVETCVQSQGQSVKAWSGVESKKPFVTNYQMLYAYDALKCM